MTDREAAAAQREAMGQATKDQSMRSADRARLWAGLNRYLASEAEHAHKEAVEEKKRDEAEHKTEHKKEE